MSLIHHWPMQESAGGTTLGDIVGGNTATITGSTIGVTDGPGGNLLSAIGMDGTNYFALDSPVAAGTGNWSILARVRGSGILQIIGVNNSVSDRAIHIGSDVLRTNVGSTIVDFTVLDTALNDTDWHSILLTHDTSDNYRCFFDGVATVEGAVSQAGTIAFEAIGRVNTGTSNDDLCDIRVFDSDESANAVTLHADLLESGVAFGGMMSNAQNLSDEDI